MEEQPIIIKRKKKVVGGHHGGSWKVAFADFATAMMAFFLVLWLTATATPEQKLAVEGYFKDPVGFTDGGSPNPVDLEGSASVIEEATQDQEASTIQIEDEVVDELADTLEQRRMRQLFQEFQERIENSDTLQEFKDQLLLDITDEGLRIQIVDRSGRPMFDSGRDELKYYSQDILFELAKKLGSVDNKISITGHTDATPFSGRPGYTNWELSADRANTARRALVAGGVRLEQIARVVGLSDSVLFDKDNPTAPVNRRISIIVLNKKTADSIETGAGSSDQPLIDLTRPTEEQEQQAREQLEDGDWFQPKEEPAPGELNW
ncbi:MAG TPA: motility protein MotB [Marinobacter hydrocarbonoclasticus]|uniref:flagellar motor protein MotB n=1 Tax=Marinobacter TaxID=2742 RepID=UPI000C5FD859|nr:MULTISPECIES: flagellar motor protein MotB [unclassified Marinobacter]MEC9038562.1 flagellar motor protein MotB [Pseudomonadota bacterium]HAX09144.1 motility protein MotB [Marinobacter nauticus]MAC21034.1 motility protein MotB [Marinobacter sp.]MAP31823.1 motility protein MotB [Marinobacter sp.]MBH91811.1 motility protein MotB [Marinobacter sp.]